MSTTLVDGAMVSRDIMAGGDDRYWLNGVLSELISSIWTSGERVQAHSMPSVEVPSTKEAARLAAGREMLRVSKRSGSLLFSVSEKSAIRIKAKRRGRVRSGGRQRYEKIEGDTSRKTGCRGSGVRLSIARTIQNSSNSGGPGENGACETYSIKNSPVLMTEMTTPTTWQKDLTAKRNEYATGGIPKYMLVHRMRMANKAKKCVTVRPVKPFSEQTVHGTVGSAMQVVGAQKICRSPRRTGLENFYDIRLFQGEEVKVCPILKKLKLKAGVVQSGIAVSEKVTQYDAAQRAAIARPQNEVAYYEGLGIEAVRGIELEVVTVREKQEALQRWK